MSYKKAVTKTETAHQDEIFKNKGREPTNYGADTDMDSPKEKASSITSKLSDGKMLTTHHDHATGKITHSYNESVNEGRVAVPLKGHPYHEKSDAELHYIVKDAGDAARKSRGMSSYNPNSGKREDTEGKYLDQMNDASTVLHHRRNGGKQLVKPKTEEVVNEVSKASLSRAKLKGAAMIRAAGSKDKEEVKKEDMNIVDTIMTNDEIPVNLYIDAIEQRCNQAVDERKEELRKTLFNFGEAHTANQLKQAVSYHSTMKRVNTDSSLPKSDRKAKQHAKAADVAKNLFWKKKGK